MFMKLIAFVVITLSGLILWQHSALEILALTPIDPIPEVRQLMAEQRYADAAEYLKYFENSPFVDQTVVQALATEIDTIRESPEYQLKHIQEGLVRGTSDETIGQMTGLVTNFLVIGDIRDLSWQAWNWNQDEEVDPVIVALSTIGLVATGLQVATFGTATPVKATVGVLKGAHKLRYLPKWLSRALVEGADKAWRSRSLDGLSDLLGDVQRLLDRSGHSGLYLLGQTTDAGSLKRMANFSARFGADSGMVWRLGGESVVKLSRDPSISTDILKRASWYGPKGLEVLERSGAVRFVTVTKFASRGAKTLYQSEWIKLLTRIPDRWLWLAIGLSGMVLMPWRWVYRR
ncbi:hypothetical protein [Allochromatium palmeri]|uniref:Uncharacterized protein n=1 Tax=Allochromatium palmeri TaxID=231048 RepID=A0A6N8EIA3_9GAMM|nr:hypothetical protein [Allochromatium palmeri]MTW22629.1 hypothetical protein [Allochromatium palmeri]